MSRVYKLKRAISIVALAILVWMAGCASLSSDEQEGGITGTGNAINCQDEKNRNHPSCIKR